MEVESFDNYTTFDESWSGHLRAGQMGSTTGNSLNQLNFASAQGGQTASFLLDANTTLDIPDFRSNITSAGYFLGRRSRSHLGNATIDFNTTMTFSLGEGSELSFDRLRTEGQCIFAGNGTCDLNVDENSNGTFTLYGNPTMRGSMGGIPVSLVAEWGYDAECTVSDLSSSGSWVGAGNVTCAGDFNFSGQNFQPRMHVSGGRFNILQRLVGGLMRLTEGELALDGGDSWNTSVFSTFEECDAASSIYIRIQDLMGALAENTTITAFTYSIDTDASGFDCSIFLEDETTGETIAIVGESSTPSIFNRRLFSDCDTSADWTEDSLTVTTSCAETAAVTSNQDSAPGAQDSAQDSQDSQDSAAAQGAADTSGSGSGGVIAGVVVAFVLLVGGICWYKNQQDENESVPMDDFNSNNMHVEVQDGINV